MNFRQELDKINGKLLSIKNFDLESFIYNYRRMVNSIYHFNNVIGKDISNKQDLSRISYNLKGITRPSEGNICYFYIENSYPKEIYNSHWCLILKDFGNTMLVVPLVSIKPTSSIFDRTCEINVKIKDFEEEGCSKLKIHQIFSADIMRINPNKNVYYLQTDFEYVKSKIKELINF